MLKETCKADFSIGINFKYYSTSLKCLQVVSWKFPLEMKRFFGSLSSHANWIFPILNRTWIWRLPMITNWNYQNKRVTWDNFCHFFVLWKLFPRSFLKRNVPRWTAMRYPSPYVDMILLEKLNNLHSHASLQGTFLWSPFFFEPILLNVVYWNSCVIATYGGRNPVYLGQPGQKKLQNHHWKVVLRGLWCWRLINYIC